MKEPYDKGIASHIGPESCAFVLKNEELRDPLLENVCENRKHPRSRLKYLIAAQKILSIDKDLIWGMLYLI